MNQDDISRPSAGENCGDAPRSALSYRDAGVDIDAGDRLVESHQTRSRHAPGARRCWRDWAASARCSSCRWTATASRCWCPAPTASAPSSSSPSTLERHDTIGIDLVAMCVNDLVVQGAEPLFFLDYYATGKLDVDVAAEVDRAASAAGCELAGAALVGGETAEMPGMYHAGDYDLAGSPSASWRRAASSTAARCAPAMCCSASPPSGPHSNGYSLIRKVLALSGADLDQDFHGRTLGDTLLAPTRIYVKPLLALFEHVEVHALAHITGGGLLENLPRVLPDGARARASIRRLAAPADLRLAAAPGQHRRARNVPHLQLRHRHGGGASPAAKRRPRVDLLGEAGETVWRIGAIEAARRPSAAPGSVRRSR